MDIPENSINEILENNPSQGTLYVLLTFMKEKGMHNLVIGECIKALSRFPEDLTLRKILAEAYLGEMRLMEAEAEFGRVIDGMKILAGAYRSQAEIYVRQKREDDAALCLKKYLAYFPEDEEAAILLEELMATSAVSAIELSEEQIDTEIPGTVEPGGEEIIEAREPDEFPEIITASLAETYFEQGQLAQARGIYEKLVDRDPEDASLKSRLDEISAMMEQKDEPEESAGLKAEDSIRRKKERMISLLDTWRVNIKELAREGISE